MQFINLDIRCKVCSNTEFVETLTPNSIHYAKLECGKCGAFLKWLPKPDNEGKRRMKYYLEHVEYCELCLRKKEELDGKCTLEEHHKLEVNNHPEFEDDPNNRIKICTRCHVILHTLRRMVRTES